jgi:hypothetical protein
MSGTTGHHGEDRAMNEGQRFSGVSGVVTVANASVAMANRHPLGRPPRTGF